MSGPDWDSSQALFLQHLRYERNLSEETLRAYASDLSQFAGYARGQVGSCPLEPGAVGPLTIRGYLASVHKSLEKTSRARKLSALRSFYRYLISSGLLADNPADLVSHPRIKQKMPSFLTVDAVFHFLEALSGAALKREHSWRKARNWALFESLYSTGIRVSELVKLNGDGVIFDEGVVRVTGKGRRERIVPIGTKALDALKYYLSAREFQFAQKRATASQPLFLNSRGGRLHGPLRQQDTQGRAYRVRALAAFERAWPEAHFRHSSSKCRGGSQGHPGDARTQKSFNDPEIHARRNRSLDAGIRCLSPERQKKIRVLCLY